MSTETPMQEIKRLRKRIDEIERKRAAAYIAKLEAQQSKRVADLEAAQQSAEDENCGDLRGDLEERQRLRELLRPLSYEAIARRRKVSKTTVSKRANLWQLSDRRADQRRQRRRRQ